jgi:hypothetical protein
MGKSFSNEAFQPNDRAAVEQHSHPSRPVSSLTQSIQTPRVWPEIITMLRRRLSEGQLVQPEAQIRYNSVQLVDLVIDCYQHGLPPTERYSLLISNLTERSLLYVQVLYSGDVVISKRAAKVSDFNTIWRELKEDTDRWGSLNPEEAVKLLNGMIPLLMGSLAA